MLTRRRLLLGLAGVAAGGTGLAGSARAIGDPTRFQIAQLRYDGVWNPRPGAALALAEEVHFRTSIDVRLERRRLSLTNPALFRHPFLLWLGGGEFPRLGRSEAAALKRYLELGGFVVVDNVGKTSPSESFDRGLRAALKRVFPAHPLTEIPDEHVLYRSFYRVSTPAGRILDRPYLEGLFLGDRLALVYSRNDLSGAWARDGFGAWRYDVIPGGEPQRERAIRLGVNLAQYALCLDYKDDHVHLNYLLHRRRWRIDPPEPPRPSPGDER